MGERAAHEPGLARPAVAGAVLSNVATIIEMGVVLVAISRPVAAPMRIPLFAAGAVAIVYGAVLVLMSVCIAYLNSPISDGLSTSRRL